MNSEGIGLIPLRRMSCTWNPRSSTGSGIRRAAHPTPPEERLNTWSVGGASRPDGSTQERAVLTNVDQFSREIPVYASGSPSVGVCSVVGRSRWPLAVRK